jgi:hypothetical protein
VSAVADLLARLPAADFERLCREELGFIEAQREFFEFAGWPDSYPPQTALGHRVIETFAQRYPMLACDAEGTA